ncbi:WD40-repeat-containing domain protein [Pelagophyceae sp. CCMP2097]|nr:WD40-repeat-containing domain protein [Pelagophyceae sp. CCMP2097]
MEDALFSRALGRLDAHTFGNSVFRARTARQPHVVDELRSPDGGVATCIDVEGGGPCDRFCVVGGGDARISLYDLDRARLVGRCARGGRTHAHSVVSANWYGSDGGAFVSASCDGALCLWDAERFRVARRYAVGAAVGGAALSRCASGATATLVATACADATLRLTDVRAPHAAAAAFGGAHRGAVTAVAWSPAVAHELCTGGADKSVRVWDVRRSGATACVSALDAHRGVARRADAHLPWEGARLVGRAHDGSIDGAKYTLDGRSLLTAGADELRCWDVHTATRRALHFDGVRNKSRGVGPLGFCFARNDLVLFPNGDDRAVLAFSLKTAALQWRTPPTPQNMRPVRCCAFRQATQMLYTAGDDGHHIFVWSHSKKLDRKKLDRAAAPARAVEAAVEQAEQAQAPDATLDALRRAIMRARREDAERREAEDLAAAAIASEASAAPPPPRAPRRRRRPGQQSGPAGDARERPTSRQRVELNS